MYLKLSIRSARRSIGNYCLYMATMVILLAVMEVSNYISVASRLQAGFQTASLPLLITIILCLLAYGIDSFLLETRAKEFANYLLLGMEKKRLSLLFLCEFFMMGILCFAVGAGMGAGLGALFSRMVLQKEGGANLSYFGQSLVQTFFYFCLVEGISAVFVKRRMDRLEIRELMQEKERSRIIRNWNYKMGGIVFILSYAGLTGLLLGIVFLPEGLAPFLISIIAVPLLGSVGAFYQWLFGALCARRHLSICTGENYYDNRCFLYGRSLYRCSLYRGNRLYMMAQVTSNSKTGVWLNSIFSICLLFAVASFLTGTVMLHPGFQLFSAKDQQWMGGVQISLCVIFMVIYFSVLSLQEIIELKQEAKSFLILHYMGKSREQIYGLIKGRIGVRMLMPVLVCLLILLPGVLLLNRKLNSVLDGGMAHILLKGAGWFGVCFLIFYGCYFGVVYQMGCRGLIKLKFRE